jgi:hypothetical protein
MSDRESLFDRPKSQVTPVTSLTYELWNRGSAGSTIAEAGKNSDLRLVFKWKEGRRRKIALKCDEESSRCI